MPHPSAYRLPHTPPRTVGQFCPRGRVRSVIDCARGEGDKFCFFCLSPVAQSAPMGRRLTPVGAGSWLYACPPPKAMGHRFAGSWLFCALLQLSSRAKRSADPGPSWQFRSSPLWVPDKLCELSGMTRPATHATSACRSVLPATTCWEGL